MNASDGWRRTAGMRLSVELSLGQLLGISVGSPIEAVSFLGPSDSHKRRDCEYRYSKSGISIVCKDGRIYSILIAVSKLETLRPYSGDWFVHEKSVEISPNTTADKIRALLGKSKSGWNDGVDAALLFERAGVDIEFLWISENNRLQYVYIQKP